VFAPPLTINSPSGQLPSSPPEPPVVASREDIRQRKPQNPFEASPPPSSLDSPVVLPPGVPATYDPANPYPVPRKPLPGPSPSSRPGNAQLPKLENLPYPKQLPHGPELSSLRERSSASSAADNNNRRRKKPDAGSHSVARSSLRGRPSVAGPELPEPSSAPPT
ncbi:hypothetical protein BIW11_14340, partial [Tropilaelaps mercedesae]